MRVPIYFLDPYRRLWRYKYINDVESVHVYTGRSQSCFYKCTYALQMSSAVCRQDVAQLGYERVYLPPYKVADTPFHIQGWAM